MHHACHMEFSIIKPGENTVRAGEIQMNGSISIAQKKRFVYSFFRRRAPARRLGTIFSRFSALSCTPPENLLYYYNY